MKKYDSVLAIDGPAGSGKSTLAKLVAQKICATYIDTGAMFRAIALGLSILDIDFSKAQLSVEESAIVSSALTTMKFEYAVDENILVRVNGLDMSSQIREHEVSKLASRVSKFTLVREYLADFQRSLVTDRLCVMEGRDIGTVIFPDAFCKVFLSASAEVRAKRRMLQLKEKGGSVDFETLLGDIKKRDFDDKNREQAPLKKAEDAVELNTSELNLEQVLSELDKIYQSKKERLK